MISFNIIIIIIDGSNLLIKFFDNSHFFYSDLVLVLELKMSWFLCKFLVLSGNWKVFLRQSW